MQPQLRGLRDLQVALKLTPPNEPTDHAAEPGDAHYALANVAVLSHSTALSGRLVSPINPRVVVMAPDTFLGFQRGVQQVELISRARDTGVLNFYLVDFEQACNQRTEGCSPGDLYTPQIESTWLRVRVRDGEELKNTAQDCRVCHQRNTDTPSLLMRELEFPWTHFFLPPGPATTPGVSGSDLMNDYVQAKGDEPYAGFALHTISAMTPFFLQAFAGPTQPLLFDAPLIEAERYPHRPDGYVQDPRPSPTWEQAYEAFKRGEQLALPYLEPRATDADKQAALTEAYRRYRSHEIAAEELPDLGDIFPDDGQQRARRGLQTEPHATAEDALIQACGGCHNDALDQNITRARFNIRVSSLDRRELDIAIERIRRGSDAEGVMPPPETRQLDSEVREKLIEYLQAEPSSLDRDGRLDTAAKLSMTGGGGPTRLPPNAL